MREIDTRKAKWQGYKRDKRNRYKARRLYEGKKVVKSAYLIQMKWVLK